MSEGIIALYFAGALVRLFLFHTPCAESISNRVEISTPLNSWQRVEEGVFLFHQNISLYGGGLFHETPLCLLFASYLKSVLQKYLYVIFIGCDLLTACFLGLVAAAYNEDLLLQQKQEKDKYSSDASHLLLSPLTLKQSVPYIIGGYLFSPYIIATCISKTTTVFGNLILSASLLALVKGLPSTFGILIAISSYQSLYPVCLLVPGFIFMKRFPSVFISRVKLLGSFIIALCSLLSLSYLITGSWEYIEATYGFILTAPDLTPNVGLFWYFFTEMFEHFRLFFLATFQINAFVYLFPLAIRLHKDPILLCMALLSLSAVFRSYPSVGDVGFYLALMPMWKHLYAFLRQTFLVGCMLVVTSVLGPVMYNLWIYNGSANANFYFAVTLAFNTAQIFLVTDFLFGHVKRQYYLFNGSKMEIDGAPARLTLQ